MVDKHGAPLSLDVITTVTIPRDNLTALSGALSFVAAATTTTTTVYQYKKRGFNTTTKQFEYWVTSSETGAPPSGNPLSDITVLQRTTVSS